MASRGAGPAHLDGDLLAPPAQLDLLTLERLDGFPVFLRIERGEPQLIAIVRDSQPATLLIELGREIGRKGEVPFRQQGQEGLSPKPFQKVEGLLRTAQLQLQAQRIAIDVAVPPAKLALRLLGSPELVDLRFQ